MCRPDNLTITMATKVCPVTFTLLLILGAYVISRRVVLAERDTGSPYRFHYYFPNDTSQSGRDGEDGGRVVQVVDISREDPHIRGTRDNDFRLKDRDALGRLQQGGLDRATRQLASTTNQVEMLLVLDKAAYDRFLTKAGGDAASAQQEIGRYFAGLVKEVNERYATVDTGGFSLRIILTRIITLTTTAESSVTESLVNNGVVNTDDTLDNFRILDNDVLKAGNPHDYAVLVTGYDLRSGNSNTIGVTFLYAACDTPGRGRDIRQGVMEDLGDEQTAVTLAHEIGHALGALHDGQSNNCNSRFFVMAPSASVPSSRSLATNPFTFTSCSLNEIRSFLAGSATNCLRSRQTAPGSEVDIVAMTTVELGQQYNADTQCRQAFGSRSRFCRTRYTSGGGVTFDDMCYNLRCGVPGSTFCGSTLPFDGTTCGDNKWCQDGLCVSSQSAPDTVSPTCPQGDDPSVECSPSVCTVEVYNSTLCCATCRQQQQPTQRPVQPVSVGGTTAPVTLPPPTPPSIVSIGGSTTRVTPTPPTGPVSVSLAAPQDGGQVTVSLAGVIPTDLSTVASPGVVSVAGTTSTTVPVTVSVAQATTDQSSGTVSVAGVTLSVANTEGTTTGQSPTVSRGAS